MHHVPVGAQGLFDGGADQALDVGARGVVRAQGVALFGIQGAFQQGSEDGGLDVRPVALRRLQEQGQRFLVQLQGLRAGEEAAVEAQDLAHHAEHVAALVHGSPELLDADREGSRVGNPLFLESVGEDADGQKAHVLGEHGEDTAHEKLRDEHGIVVVGFELAGQFGQTPGHLARDLGRVLGWIKIQRIGEDLAQKLDVRAEIA